MTAYVRMLLVRWFRQPWGAGGLWAMAIGPCVITAATQLHDLASPNSLGFRVQTVLYCTVLFGVGLVAFGLLTLVEEEKADGRGRALRVAGIDGASLATSLVVSGCLIAVAFTVIGVGSSVMVSIVISGFAASWATAGLVIAIGTCAMVPVALLTALTLPTALSRSAMVGVAMTTAWMTTTAAAKAGVTGSVAAKELIPFAAIGAVAFVVLVVVQTRTPMRFRI